LGNAVHHPDSARFSKLKESIMSLAIRTRIENLKDEIRGLEESDTVTPKMVRAWVGSDNMSVDSLIALLTECVNDIPRFKYSVQEYWEDQLEDTMDWSKTTAMWDGEDWLFAGVPPEAGWASGETCFSERELGMCISPEHAIKALKAWVAESKGEM
jgi:hypothetical protein